jgi:hypothetical protein
MDNKIIYYLGIEAKQRKNDYVELEEALGDAHIAAKRIGIPIRVFCLTKHNDSKLVTVVNPRDPGKVAPRVVDQLRLIQ